MKILLIIYNPTSGPGYGYRKPHEVFDFFPSIDSQIANYIADMTKAGHGRFTMEVVERIEVDDLPPLVPASCRNSAGIEMVREHRWVDRDLFFDNIGVLYFGDRGEYFDMFNNGRADYPAMINDPRFGIVNKIDSGAANLVCILYPPGCGLWETAMAGPGAYWVNGSPIEGIASRRRFVVMGHGYNRSVECWLEVTAHMTENIMSRTARNWPRDRRARNRDGVTVALHDWDYFTLTEWQNYDDRLVAPGHAQVGTGHYPPNAPRGSDYAFAFTDLAESAAANWYQYPDLSGAKQRVNRETWNTFNGDYHRGFLCWWFDHIPANPGSHDGILNNWWPYIWDVNRDPDAREAR